MSHFLTECKKYIVLNWHKWENVLPYYVFTYLKRKYKGRKLFKSLQGFYFFAQKSFANCANSVSSSLQSTHQFLLSLKMLRSHHRMVQHWNILHQIFLQYIFLRSVFHLRFSILDLTVEAWGFVVCLMGQYFSEMYLQIEINLELLFLPKPVYFQHFSEFTWLRGQCIINWSRLHSFSSTGRRQKPQGKHQANQLLFLSRRDE